MNGDLYAFDYGQPFKEADTIAAVIRDQCGESHFGNHSETVVLHAPTRAQRGRPGPGSSWNSMV
jgi:hypothetical protein